MAVYLSIGGLWAWISKARPKSVGTYRTIIYSRWISETVGVDSKSIYRMANKYEFIFQLGSLESHHQVNLERSIWRHIPWTDSYNFNSAGGSSYVGAGRIGSWWFRCRLHGRAGKGEAYYIEKVPSSVKAN